MKIAKVIVPFPLYNIFDYETIENVNIGSLINISFSKINTIGLVIDIINENENENKNNKKLKKITKVLYIQPLRTELIQFVKWVADYNIIPIGLVFKLVFSEKYILSDNSKEVNVYKFLNDTNKKITEKQKNVVEFLKENFNKEYYFEELKKFCSLNILKTLVKNNVIYETKVKFNKINYNINLDKIDLNRLSEEQYSVYNQILNFIKNDNKPILLEGATGSGKTELYFHLFDKYLKENMNNQILFLLPEIALTAQFINRIKSQFKCDNVAIWHSNISSNNKKIIWNGVLNNEIKLVIGARSSLFLPFKKLSLIVTDEEHDNSYKQVDNGCYNARDMAVVRAKLNNCPIILGSATPSLESLINVDNKKYNYVFLKNRFGKSIMPIIEIVDLTKEKIEKNKYISKKLINEIKIELDKKNQILLYMNRRGYAPVAICNECGYKFTCQHCSCCLTVHQNAFICHQCGYKIQKQDDCPSCGEKNSIIFFGPGVEKIEKEIKEYFPEKNIAIITSDTVQNIKGIKEILDKILDNKIDIIIGTQMITKGYDFPKLTLVGVLDADASLFGANFRATEKTYQLLTQVIGRAGRREDLSKAIIQSYTPDNLIIKALKNNQKDILINFEKENRKLINLPPYGKIVMLTISGKDEIKVYKKIKEIATLLPCNNKNLELYGPTPATLYKLNNEYRFKLLIKTPLNINIQKIVLNIINNIKIDNKLKLKIDMNPYFI